MDSNPFLSYFGLDGDDYYPADPEPTDTDKGKGWHLKERRMRVPCPFCGCYDYVVVHSHYTRVIDMTDNAHKTTTATVERILYECKSCGRTFAADLRGLRKNASFTKESEMKIMRDFHGPATFSEIGKRFNKSETWAIKVFDAMYTNVARSPMPKAICLDELQFLHKGPSKYPCIITDAITKKPVDLVRSRQKEALESYFRAIPMEEMASILFIISDMYDEYWSAQRMFAPKATMVVDPFHVAWQLTHAISVIRARAMKAIAPSEDGKRTPEYKFMMRCWKEFGMRPWKLPKKPFSWEGGRESHQEMIERCLALSRDLSEAYDAIQSLYKSADGCETVEDGLKAVDFMVGKLRSCSSETLTSVGETYKKWRVPIANGFARKSFGWNLTNGPAENMNSRIRKLLSSSYGYQNFERLRKRVLLVYRDKLD
jgi:transposase